nr:hypothetical protein [Rhodopirellula sp. JC740]
MKDRTSIDDSSNVRPEDLLDTVCDRESFIAFVEALASERERAQQIEREHPNRYVVDGALGWMNGDIQSYLYASLDYFAEGPLKDPPATEPSWKMLAEFLWCGKIIE